jgi:hypothetical protein
MKKSQLADQSDQLSHGPITKRLKKESRINMARGTKLQRTGIPCSRGETIEWELLWFIISILWCAVRMTGNLDIMVHRKYMTKLFSTLLSGVKRLLDLPCWYVNMSATQETSLAETTLVQEPLPSFGYDLWVLRHSFPPRSNHSTFVGDARLVFA